MRPTLPSRQDHVLLSQQHQRHGATSASAMAEGGRPPGFAAYSWVCCVSSDLRFVYVYGLRAECARLNEFHRETMLRKGTAVTLALVQSSAEAAAEALYSIYEGIGSVEAMPVRTFLKRRYGVDLDRLDAQPTRA